MPDEATWKRRFRVLGLLGLGIGLLFASLGALGAPFVVMIAGFMTLSVWFIVFGIASARNTGGYGQAWVRWGILGGSRLSPDEAIRQARWLGLMATVGGGLFLLVGLAAMVDLFTKG